MKTETLYYNDSHMKSFTATVLSCETADNNFAVTLNRTAFFPEGGGQAGDIGTLNGIRVLDTQKRNGEILHIAEKPLAVGEDVAGEIDWNVRFRRMQNHSGEHIVSGLVYSRFGLHNVGFHMGADGVIIDFDGYITPDKLRDIEAAANAVVTENRSVTSWFPDSEELADISYRSKKELTEAVRLVKIDGCDICACCAPHVKSTGEIGVIRIYDSIKRRGGVRLRMLAGLTAFEDMRQRSDSVSRISALLSVKPENVAEAVEKLLKERGDLRYALGGLKRRLAELKVQSLPESSGNTVFFEPDYEAADAKYMAELAVKRCGGISAVFFGDDKNSRYCIVSESVNLREKAKEINAAISGHGGGNVSMISGAIAGKIDKSRIERYFCENC